MPSVMIHNSTSSHNLTPTTEDFVQPKNGFNITIMVMQVLVIIVALLGNILICSAILIHERLRTHFTNYFIFSLSLSDIITAIIVMPMDVDQVLKNYKWTYGEAMCNIFTVAYLIAAPLSMLNLLAVSIDRYNAIANPLHYSNIMTPKVIVASIFSLWTYAILFTVIAMAGWPMYPSSVLYGTCHFNIKPAYSVVSSVINFVIPTIVMCVLYFKIYKVAHAHARRIGRHENISHSAVEYNSGTNGGGTSERRSMSKNIKAAKTIAILVSAFLFCWMPYTLVSSASILCGRKCYDNTPEEVITLTLLLAYMNSALNPFLYAFHNRDFRESFRRLLKLQFHYI
ncbi:octopamine receptor beta-3R-like [Actinia tenebrosa]|uniref:Octopamine receptor beta-3R-like n=1 Tax=Actinia tenebrosa TaxID=6105 RepID=A0A6P8J3Y6_ACTTE|nr:octopamine receptor beta-3R-like [Actinia tenebrosa]XP_031574311.1 octopamine receptor beta-3R-like [Actinia tenebrosa]XP_031574319.1 octopamine receptor beta-3R-like [Actinia tenebrosa]XP_031574325.1 octopamine receptor beta-3R-like [Actinia tenebrosa]XP_031574333.1 octopamine receptor beta-3R-like [Actinia tenebrosa]XP_031574340.1 octopamine receptor beta-3R-like [Actinia tenebrosa]XP_031574347.1 octopamine receptor beta-3R-like [Actinia tenebrosa]XP_031574352.1 octopamine receptor beta